MKHDDTHKDETIYTNLDRQPIKLKGRGHNFSKLELETELSSRGDMADLVDNDGEPLDIRKAIAEFDKEPG